MAGGSWKVAYADFMTAMMAFFLLMWLLNATTEEQRVGLAGYFSPGATVMLDRPSPTTLSNNPIVQYVDSVLQSPKMVLDEVEQSRYAVAQELNGFLMQDAIPSSASGVTSDHIGVLMHINSSLLFKANSIEFTELGEKVLDQVVQVMLKYKLYLVVRGHCDSSETLFGDTTAKWDLSSARANAAIRYLISKGINQNYIRSVAYADTRPLVQPGSPGSVEKNSRVEFNFHRQEPMSSIVGY